MQIGIDTVSYTHLDVYKRQTLHGIVSLRVSKPAFPWAPTDELVDRALLALCAIPLP